MIIVTRISRDVIVESQLYLGVLQRVRSSQLHNHNTTMIYHRSFHCTIHSSINIIRISTAELLRGQPEYAESEPGLHATSWRAERYGSKDIQRGHPVSLGESVYPET